VVLAERRAPAACIGRGALRNSSSAVVMNMLRGWTEGARVFECVQWPANVLGIVGAGGGGGGGLAHPAGLLRGRLAVASICVQVLSGAVKGREQRRVDRAKHDAHHLVYALEVAAPRLLTAVLAFGVVTVFLQRLEFLHCAVA
jgi:hypothetical protein